MVKQTDINLKAVGIKKEAHDHLLEITRRLSEKRGYRVRMGAVVEHLIKKYGDKDKELQ